MGAEAPEATTSKLAEELEGRMHELARREDYEAAAAVRDELSNLQVDDEAEVLRANSELYAAFSSRDLKRMEAIWLRAPYVQCIHPYEKRSSGYTDVCESWKRLFEALPKSAAARRSTSVTAEDVRILVRGCTAIVNCVEQVASRLPRRPIRSMSATNIFRKVSRRWYLIHRHVSSEGDSTAGPALLGAEPAGEGSGAMGNWRLQQLYQALAADWPGARIIIQPPGSQRGFGGEEDDDDDDDDDHFQRAIGAQLDGMQVLGSGLGDEEGDGSDVSDDEDGLDDDELYAEEDDGGAEAARETVRALRRLKKEGHLTQQAKIQLISEMLRNPGESMPERAHELLLAEVPDEERKAAWDDFAAIVAWEAAKLDPPRAKPSEGADGRRAPGGGRSRPR